MKEFLSKLALRYGGDELRRLIVLLSLLIVSIGTLLSYLYASTLLDSAQRARVDETHQLTSSLETYIQQRMQRKQSLLYAAAALCDAKTNITQADWTQFARSTHLVEEYPAILGLGYASYTHNDGNGTSAIQYLEPNNIINQRAISFDMLSEPTRREAMNKARDTASAVMSGPVHLVQDADDPAKRGVLVYYPVYDLSLPITTVQERRTALTAFVYIAFRPVDIMTVAEGTAVPDTTSASYTLSDSGQDLVPLHGLPDSSMTHIISDSRDMSVYGRTWRLELSGHYSKWEPYLVPAALLLLGIGFSAGLAFAIYRLLTTSSRRLQSSHQQQLMQTRDELLALTSHQLRTPASGVKQYLGMLTQGFMGDLTPEQHAVANKAYAANERQLETINQILHVAKADAQQLKLELAHIDVVPLVHDIVSSMSDDAACKSVRITVSGVRSAYVRADERYLRMAIENLISNAIKYSYENSPVTIKVTSDKSRVLLTVTDHGVGLRPEDYDKLFVKFSRVNNDLSAKEGGTGLGLYLAQQIAMAHHGQISVISWSKQRTKQTAFTLTLPISRSKSHRNKGVL
ncbi:MAG: CHASE domain-containing protein [Candidatus Saccharimonadales bacterium]